MKILNCVGLLLSINACLTIAMIPSPIKIKRKYVPEIDYSECFFCQKSNNELLHSLKAPGLTTLKAFADQNSNKFLFDDGFLSKNPVYHLSCYSKFTPSSKKSNDLPSQNERNSKRISLDYKTICFLCEKDRDKKGSRKLTVIATEDRQKNIHKKAKEINDTKILTAIQGFGNECIDMVSNNFRYHTSCMTSFMNTKLKSESNGNLNPYETAYNILLDDIGTSLLNGDAVYYVKDLVSRYQAILVAQNVEEPQKYKSSNLILRFKKTYGDKIQVLSRGFNNCSLICSSNLSIANFASLVGELKFTISEETVPEDDDFPESNITLNDSGGKDVFLLAKRLRTTILSSSCNQNIRKFHSLSFSDENTENCIPSILFNFIAWIISDSDQILEDDEKIVVDKDSRTKTLSFCQDIVKAVTNSDLPKHVGIALHVMKTCRSKNLITLLNRFGHSVSYTDCQRIISSIATNEMSNCTFHNNLPIPTSLKPDMFVQFAFDNLDFYDDTKDGKTFHGTTHIFYQHDNIEHKCEPDLMMSKIRNVQLKGVKLFQPVSSTTSLKDRREARKILGLEFENFMLEHFKISFSSKMLFFLLRNLPTKTLTMNSDNNSFFDHTWDSYLNIVSIPKTSSKTFINYGPIFPSSPVSADVVQTSMEYFLAVSRNLGQKYAVVTCDQAIYDIAQGIKLNSPKFDDVILQLGGFHIAQNFLKTISFFVKDSGFEEILINSASFSQANVAIVMKVSNYYKALRCHFVFAQAIFGLIFESFEDFLIDVEELYHLKKLNLNITEFLNKIENDPEGKNRAYEALMEYFLIEISPLWESYITTLDPTAQFWYQYLCMVSILFDYVHAVHSGMWDEHLLQIQNMVPFVAAAGHHNYMKCLPKYLNDMRNLPSEVSEQFKKGNFNVHLKKGTRNAIWTDMALEETYNKDAKTVLFKGATTNPELREKYIAALPKMAEVSSCILNSAGMIQDKTRHHGETKQSSADDHEIVEKLKNFIRLNCSNPFSTENRDLINVCTGAKAANNDTAFGWKFGCEILNSVLSSDSAKTLKLSTFKLERKKEKKNEALKEIYVDEIKMLKNLSFVENELSEKEKAFGHEWCTYPPSLFEPCLKNSFIPRKSAKHEFLKVLEEDIGDLYELPKYDNEAKVCVIFDGMAFIQKYQFLGAKNFQDLSSEYASVLLKNLPKKCRLVHFVGDRYDFSVEESLKTHERNRRLSKTNSSLEILPLDSAPLPTNWADFINNSNNKSNLLKYITKKWSENLSIFPKDLKLVMGGTSETRGAIKIENNTVEEIPSLYCPNHEEADIRIFAHLLYSIEYDDVTEAIISGSDTDLVIYSLYHLGRLEKLTKLWVNRKQSFLPIHRFLNALKEKYQCNIIANTILWTYVMSGCDIISYPFGKTKAKAAKILLKHLPEFQKLAHFGENLNFVVTEEYLNEARSYFIKLYDTKQFTSLNKLRMHLFVTKKTTDLRRLPPTENAFYQHFLRSLYWILVIKQSLNGTMKLPSIREFGYTIDRELGIQEVLFTNSRFPVLEKVKKCQCKSSCGTKCKCTSCNIACSCYAFETPCRKGNISFSDDEEDNV